MSLPLLIATRNLKKKREILEILSGIDLELLDLTAFPDAPEVVEDGATFEANARKKASETARATGQWTLGEDSGLIVPGLGGRPGVYSARYAGKQGDDEANNQKLIAEIKILPVEKRAAYYVCTAALSDAAGNIHAVVEGRCNGVITPERHGEGGFGYDPYFLIPELHATFGELSSRVKHALSHRARALGQLRPVLRALLNERA
jgi:XTP/dITP diphosphohydrolase